jgi:hypothetical protein
MVNRLAKQCSDLNDGRHDSHKEQTPPFNHGANGHRQSAEGPLPGQKGLRHLMSNRNGI